MKKLLSILVFFMFFQSFISVVYSAYPYLSDYPEFLLDNLYIVYGIEGSSSEVVAGTNILANIKSEHPGANAETKLDTEVSNPYSTYRNFILIGNPCHNKLTALAMKKTYPACGDNSGIPKNAAIIKIYDDCFQDGYDVLVVAGWDDFYTKMAASVLQKHNQFLSDKNVKAIKITYASSSGITEWSEEEATTTTLRTTTTIRSETTTLESTTTIETTTILPTTIEFKKKSFFDDFPSDSIAIIIIDAVFIIVIVSVVLYLYKKKEGKSESDQMTVQSLSA